MNTKSGRHLVVDWGSSNFRAYRFSPSGEIAERHHANAGILSITDGAYEPVLMREIGGWITPDSEVFFSGMITSRNGWVETPYAVVPAQIGDLAKDAVTRTGSTGATYHFLPGVSAMMPLPDVMRGEEIQIFGAIDPDESATLVLPGTHSKWVSVTNGRIDAFRTFLTGECYALLTKHSIVGRLIPAHAHAFNAQVFLAGVLMANDKSSINLLNDVFTARSGALLGAFAVEEIADRLSGILIGHELKAGLSMHEGRNSRLLLIGEEELTKRYKLALAALGQDAVIGRPDAAVEGFRRLVALQGSR